MSLSSLAIIVVVQEIFFDTHQARLIIAIMPPLLFYPAFGF
jgi:hypothetical protein